MVTIVLLDGNRATQFGKFIQNKRENAMVAAFWFAAAIAAVMYIIHLNKAAKRDLSNKREQLDKSGFQIDHLLDGSYSVKHTNAAHQVAFDDAAKEIAFIYLDKDKITKYKYQDISGWNWNWFAKNGRRRGNELQFTIRDAKNPLIKVCGLSENYAEHWMAKLDAIFNA